MQFGNTGTNAALVKLSFLSTTFLVTQAITRGLRFVGKRFACHFGFRVGLLQSGQLSIKFFETRFGLKLGGVQLFLLRGNLS